ncbi:hypothetical protein AeMF1_006804 [Aphanomyces euteiches]|nr:hypothetical protein AeMF1_006804 [Aphanomyces euteiches]
MGVKQQALRSLKACEHSTQARRLQQRTAERREFQLRQLREDAMNRRRRRLSADEVVAKSHKSNLTGITSFDTADNTLLFGTSPKCVLEPEVTQGPYYVKGELIRNDCVNPNLASISLPTSKSSTSTRANPCRRCTLTFGIATPPVCTPVWWRMATATRPT